VNKVPFTIHLLHPAYWVTWILLFLFFVLSLMPIFVLDFIGERIGDIYAKMNKRRYGFVKTNLSLCFAGKSAAEIDGMCVEHFRSLARSLMHFGKLWWSPKSRLEDFLIRQDFDHLENIKNSNKNIIVLTCHTVGLEFVVAALSMLYPCAGPYKPMKNPVVDWMIANGRTRFGVNIFTRDDGLRPLVKYARKGFLIIYLADEDLGAQRTLFAPFFGVEKATIPVLGRLANTCDAAVVPCCSYYDKAQRKYVIKCLPALTDFPLGNDKKDALKMNQTLEQMILLSPEQYLWGLRFFKTRPDGEAPVYG